MAPQRVLLRNAFFCPQASDVHSFNYASSSCSKWHVYIEAGCGSSEPDIDVDAVLVTDRQSSIRRYCSWLHGGRSSRPAGSALPGGYNDEHCACQICMPETLFRQTCVISTCVLVDQLVIVSAVHACVHALKAYSWAGCITRCR